MVEAGKPLPQRERPLPQVSQEKTEGARNEPLPSVGGEGLARIMHETPSRDRGDGRATGQPSRGTAGLDLRRTFQYDARYETRGRPEGRPDPRSQQVARA